MKIVFIGKFSKIHDEEGKALSLEKLGHTVYRFNENTFNSDTFTNNINSVLSLKPDIVMYTKLRIPDRSNFVKILKKKKILCVCWFPDYCNVGTWPNTAFNINNINNDPLLSADLLCIPDGNNTIKWKSIGVNQHCIRQGIYDELCFKGTPKQFEKKDILFVGSINSGLYNYRKNIITFLKENYGDKFIHYGASNSDEIRNEQLNDLISSVKIVIGDSVYAPYYWSNRIYETIGRGGFCIHSYSEGIDQEYQVGKHFDIYQAGNLNELKEKIDFYLKNDNLRESISSNGLEYTKKYHTIYNRAKQVIELCEYEIKKRI